MKNKKIDRSIFSIENGILTNIDEEALSEIKTLVIPDDILEIRINYAEQLFNDSVTKLIVGKKVRIIGMNSFCGFVNLNKIEFKKNSDLEIIEYAAFNSTDINELDLRNCCNLKEISYAAFQSCRKLECIHFPENDNSPFRLRLHDNAFSGCNSLKKLNLTHYIKYIGRNCFAYCDNLKTVCTLNTSLAISSFILLGEGVFAMCRSLEEIEISTNCIPKKCFFCCGKLKKVSILHDYLTYGFGFVAKRPFLDIEDNAFGCCDNLKEIHLSLKTLSYVSPNCKINSKTTFYGKPSYKITAEIPLNNIETDFDYDTSNNLKVNLRKIFELFLQE